MDFIAWHDRPAADHLNQVDTYAAQGYRTISLCVYGSPADPRYAAVMVKRPVVVAQRQRIGLSRDQFQQLFDQQAAAGWGPLIVTATGPAQAPTIAAVFHQLPAAPLTKFGLTAAEFQAVNEAQWAPGGTAAPAWVDVYGLPGDERYVAVWLPNPDRAAWHCDPLGSDGATFQQRFDALRSGGARLAHAAVRPSGGIVGVFDDRVVADGFIARTGLTSAEYQVQFDALTAQGYAPVRVCAKGPLQVVAGVVVPTGENRFAAVFQRSETIAPRSFALSDPGRAVPQIDSAVEGIMRSNGIRGASLAITAGARLVYAQGYGFAEPGAAPVTPTTFFRQASVTKTFTAYAIHALIARGTNVGGGATLGLDTLMQDVLQLTQPDGSPPADPRFGHITVQHLLEMTAGVEPDLADPAVAAAPPAVPLPVGAWRFAQYCASRKLTADPGSRAGGYNNTGYLLLGLIVAKLCGAGTFVDGLIPLMEPLAIKRIRSARSLVQVQPPDEARYQPNCEDIDAQHYRFPKLGIARSVMSPDQPFVTLGYGDVDLEKGDGAGCLSAAAVDVARLIASLSAGDGNPLLDRAQVTEWLAAAAAASAAEAQREKVAAAEAASPSWLVQFLALAVTKTWGFNGFDAVSAVDAANGIFTGYKGGELSSTQDGIGFVRGGLGYAICWNRKTPADNSWYPLFEAVLASTHDWGTADLFPLYGMPSFPSASIPPAELVLPHPHP